MVKYSASFAGEQLHSLTTSLSRVLQSLRRLAMELNKPKARWKQEQIERKIQRWLSAPFLAELIRYRLQEQDGGWHLQFDFDTAALPQLLNHRLGRTVLLTNRMDWSAEQVVAGYCGQQSIERVFRGLKDGEWLGWDPMYHWTDRKIRIHAFYCMLGISLLQYVHQQAKARGRICRWSNCSRNSSRSNSSSCSIRLRAKRDRPAPPMCSRSSLSPNKPWSRLWALLRWLRSTQRG